MKAIATFAAGDSVEAFRSWEREERKDWRRRLLRCRDNAGVRALSYSSPDARALLWHVQNIAARWAWSSAPDEDLRLARDACVRFANAATNLEELEMRHG